jgi:hypothetical protein
VTSAATNLVKGEIKEKREGEKERKKERKLY